MLNGNYYKNLMILTLEILAWCRIIIIMLENIKKVVVFGANGAIGHALCHQYAEAGADVFAVSRTEKVFKHDNVQNIIVDYDDQQVLADVTEEVFQAGAPDLVIVAVGALCVGDKMPEKSINEIDAQYMSDLHHINTVLPAVIMKHVLSRMPRDHQYVFAALSARVGSISDNRLGGWYSYRASKAALNMIIKTAAIEVGRRNKEAVIVGLHPGTVDSKLSKPFQGNVPEGKLFSAEQSARYLSDVIGNLDPTDTGKVFDWKGEVIAP